MCVHTLHTYITCTCRPTTCNVHSMCTCSVCSIRVMVHVYMYMYVHVHLQHFFILYYRYSNLQCTYMHVGLAVHVPVCLSTTGTCTEYIVYMYVHRFGRQPSTFSLYTCTGTDFMSNFLFFSSRPSV